MMKPASLNHFVAFASVAGLFGLAPTLADAANPILCQMYAQSAVQQFNAAQNKGCAVSGARWHANFQTHRNWCLGLPNIGPANNERQARQNHLNSCTPPGGNPGGVNPICDVYANEALKTASEANALGCGFSGARWVLNYQAHYNWCKNHANPASGMHEHAARASQLATCKANLGGNPGGNPGGLPGGNWVFPDSHIRYLNPGDVAPLSIHELWAARNEIYARKGYIFKTNKARTYFQSKPWYQPLYHNVSLSGLEMHNVNLIKSYE